MIGLVEFVNEALKEVPYNGFAIIKPGFLEKQDDIEELFQDNGWTISDETLCTLSRNDAENLYSPHKDKDFYNDLCEYMSSDKCLCYKLYNKDSDDPIEDLKELKEIARKKWGKDEMRNCLHSSDSKENVERESKICFSVNDK